MLSRSMLSRFCNKLIIAILLFVTGFLIQGVGAAIASTPCSGAIGDFVWHDQNRNGLQDSGEPGIDGVTVILKYSSGYEYSTTTGLGPMNQHGYYQFTGVCPDTYFVEVVTPAGFSPTSPCSASQTLGNDSNCSPAQVDLTTDNSSNQTIDFGLCGMI
jgi:hypothetical protein